LQKKLWRGDNTNKNKMDNSFLGLLAVCSAMFLGAFIAGLSCYRFSRRQLAWLNCFATGLLLGTALGVIIPEGVRALYDTHEEPGPNEHLDHHDDDDHEHSQHRERILGK
jgi:hypothetical protein